ncbi:MAG: hypothetical protein F7B59_01315, partial [Desulfurococcales archaeon]|nr:hypothetical protein [Desulfurococcales archaeon]
DLCSQFLAGYLYGRIAEEKLRALLSIPCWILVDFIGFDAVKRSVALNSLLDTCDVKIYLYPTDTSLNSLLDTCWLQVKLRPSQQGSQFLALNSLLDTCEGFYMSFI